MRSVFSRRQFLGAAGAMAGGLAAWGHRPSLLCAADKQDDRFGGWPLGIQSYSLRTSSYDAAMEIIHQDLGLQFVELSNVHLPDDAKEEQIQKALDKARSLSVKINGYGVRGFTKDHEANRRLFELAKRLGIRTLSADPTEDSFDSLDKLVVEYDVRIAIHNHGPGAGTTRSATCWAPSRGIMPTSALRRPGTLHPSRRRPGPRRQPAGRPAVWLAPEGLRPAQGQCPGRDFGPRAARSGRRVPRAEESRVPPERLLVGRVRRARQRSRGRSEALRGRLRRGNSEGGGLIAGAAWPR